jgi:hypothetical protein
MTPFAVIIGFMALMGALGIVVALMPRPSRSCPQCEGPVALTAKRCRACGYRFGPDGSDRYVR